MNQAEWNAKLSQLTVLGYDQQTAHQALIQANGNVEMAASILVASPPQAPSQGFQQSTEADDPQLKAALAASLQDSGPPAASASGQFSPDDEQLSKAIEMSLQTANVGSFEPLNPEQRKRVDGTPVGLKNVGNTCYFNSLMQTYFMIPQLVKEIGSFKPHPTNEENKDSLDNKSMQLVLQLQRLFAYMTRSARKYQDPSPVLNALVDDYGNQIKIGEQEDVGEFNMVLISRIEQGLRTKLPPQEATSPDSPSRQLQHQSSMTEHSAILKSAMLQAWDEHQIISHMFYGKSIEVIQAAEADGTVVSSASNTTFGQLMLQVDQKDLLSAWDSAFHDTIEDYTTPLGHQTAANQEVWIEVAPQILVFQVQRVQYDIASGQSVKINSKFEFTDQIFVDRFLYANRESSTALRARELGLKEKVRLLEQALEKFEDFNGTGVGLVQSVENTIACLKSQLEQTTAAPVEGIDLFTTDAVSKSIEKAAIESSIAVQTQLLAQVNTKVASMQSQLASLKAEIQAIYNFPEFKQHPYNLHSIMIHDGQAGSGHYYSYIVEPESKKWRRYSDINVSEVEEADVIANSLGGVGQISAYCFFYVRPDIVAPQGPLLLRQYSVEGINQATDQYTEFIPAALKAEVDQDNVKLEEEIVEYHVTSTMKQITDLYSERKAQFTSYAASAKSGQVTDTEIKHELVNFMVKLAILGHENLAKWLVLDECVRTIDEAGRGLKELGTDDPLYVKLRSQFLSNTREAPSSLELTGMDESTLLTERASYNRLITDAKLCTYILCALNDLNFEKALVGLAHHFARPPSGEMSTYLSIPKDCAKMLALRLTSEVKSAFYTGDVEKGMACARLAVLTASNFISVGDVHVEQTKANIARAFSWLQANVPNSYAAVSAEGAELLSRCGAGVIAQPHISLAPDSSADFSALLTEVAQPDFCAWTEGWRPEAIARRFQIELNRLKSVHQAWVALHISLSQHKQLHLDADVEAREAAVGIKPELL